MENCPCGSGLGYAECCEPIIKGKRPAATPEELMRARYTAHVKVEVDFIYDSTHADHRQGYDHQGTRRWAEEAEWLGLEVVDSAVSDDGKSGEVEFIARFRDRSGIRSHHERGQFRQEKKKWYFTEGEMVKSQPIKADKIGRNDPCSCGSGKKYKKCCAV